MPRLPNNPSPAQLLAAYDGGFLGAALNRATWEAFCERSAENPRFAASAADLDGLHRGKRALLWRARERFDPGAFSQEAQQTGDCVAHADRNTYDTARCVEILAGEAEEYHRRGAVEPQYGDRGHSGPGLDPARVARFSTEVGFAVRQPYPAAAVDFTEYNARLAISWGRRGTPEKVREICRDHPVGAFTLNRDPEHSLDLLAAGFPAHSGQKYGFRPKSDAAGLAIPGKKWNHGLATLGFDDTREFYKCCVVQIPNTWGPWNSPPQFWPPEEVYGPWIPGLMVIPFDIWADHFARPRQMLHYSDITGFPARDLPDFGFSSYLG